MSPEPLEVCEQVEPAERTATPTASLPYPPFQPEHLPSQKAKKSLERVARADTISAAQWVWAYLEENNRLPKLWREFQCLLPTSHGLLATHHAAKEGWIVEYPTLCGSIGVEEIPSKGFPWKP